MCSQIRGADSSSNVKRPIILPVFPDLLDSFAYINVEFMSCWESDVV